MTASSASSVNITVRDLVTHVQHVHTLSPIHTHTHLSSALSWGEGGGRGRGTEQIKLVAIIIVVFLLALSVVVVFYLSFLSMTKDRRGKKNCNNIYIYI